MADVQYKLNFPIQTEKAKLFWESRHRLNRIKAIIAFSLDLDNANDNLRRAGYYRQYRKKYLDIYDCIVHNPNMDGTGNYPNVGDVPFSDLNEFWYDPIKICPLVPVGPGVTAKAATVNKNVGDADFSVASLFTVTGGVTPIYTIASGDSVTLVSGTIHISKIGDTVINAAVAGGNPASAQVTIKVAAAPSVNTITITSGNSMVVGTPYIVTATAVDPTTTLVYNILSTGNTAGATISGTTVNATQAGSFTLEVTGDKNAVTATKAITVTAAIATLTWDAHPSSGVLGTDLTFSWTGGKPDDTSNDFEVVVLNPGGTEHDRSRHNSPYPFNTTPIGGSVVDGTWKITVNDASGQSIEQDVVMAKKPVTYSSSDITFSQSGVNGSGVITKTSTDKEGTTVVLSPTTGLSNGDTVTATITALPGYSVTPTSTTFTISNLPSGTVDVTGVSLDQTTLSKSVGDTAVTLVATVAPPNATNKNVTWSSSNSGVAAVSTSGVVTFVAPGTSTITVTTVDQGKTATCSVNVIALPSFTAQPNDIDDAAHATTKKGQAYFQTGGKLEITGAAATGMTSYRWEKSSDGTTGWTTVGSVVTATTIAPFSIATAAKTDEGFYRVVAINSVGGETASSTVNAQCVFLYLQNDDDAPSNGIWGVDPTAAIGPYTMADARVSTTYHAPISAFLRDVDDPTTNLASNPSGVGTVAVSATPSTVEIFSTSGRTNRLTTKASGNSVVTFTLGNLSATLTVTVSDVDTQFIGFKQASQTANAPSGSPGHALAGWTYNGEGDQTYTINLSIPDERDLIAQLFSKGDPNFTLISQGTRNAILISNSNPAVASVTQGGTNAKFQFGVTPLTAGTTVLTVGVDDHVSSTMFNKGTGKVTIVVNPIPTVTAVTVNTGV